MYRSIRPVQITLSFTKDNIINNDLYKKFIEEDPDMEDELDDLVDEFIDWASNSQYYTKNDFYYRGGCTNANFMERGDWGCDDNYSEDCKTWDDALEQQGTTGKKFSISKYFPDESDGLKIATLFKNIGCNIMVATYSSWRLGYDYTVRHIDASDEDDRDETKYYCIVLE